MRQAHIGVRRYTYVPISVATFLLHTIFFLVLCQPLIFIQSMYLQIGWSYGSMAEDILTGQRIHSAGWKSTSLDTNPPAFLGCAPTGGPASLTQYKRWATGLLEILLGPNTPIIATIFKRLQFRQYLGYLVFYVWSMRAPFELCYALLGPFCLFRNHSFLLKVNFCLTVHST